MTRPHSLVCVGKIIAAHGVRGEVKIACEIEPSRIPAVVSDKFGRKQFHIAHTREESGGQIIASFEHIGNRNEAETLIGLALFAEIAHSENAKKNSVENSWNAGELIGLEARLINGTRYGKVMNIYNFGAGDIVEMEKADGSLEMLPFRNAYFGEINISEGYMVVIPPDYVEQEHG